MKDTTNFIISEMFGIIITLLVICAFLLYNNQLRSERNEKKLDYIYSVLSDPEQIEINLQP